MARSSRDLVVYDPQNRKFVRLRDETGAVKAGFEKVYFELVEDNVAQAADPWGAQAANVITQINNDDPNNEYFELAIDAGQEGAKRGTIQVYRANTKPTAMLPGEICILPDGTTYIGNFSGLPSLLTAEQNTRLPTAADDATKGYKVGDIWALLERDFENVLQSSYLSKFKAGTSGTVSRPDAESVRLTAGASTGYASAGLLDGGVLNKAMVAGHKYYILAYMDAGGAATSMVLRNRDVAIATTGSAGGTFQHALFVPAANYGSANVDATMQVAANSAVTLRQMLIVDLTVTQGEGKEYTIGEAFDAFSPFAHYQAVYAAPAKDAFRCYSAAAGAAGWLQMA